MKEAEETAPSSAEKKATKKPAEKAGGSARKGSKAASAKTEEPEETAGKADASPKKASKATPQTAPRTAAKKRAATTPSEGAEKPAKVSHACREGCKMCRQRPCHHFSAYCLLSSRHLVILISIGCYRKQGKGKPSLSGRQMTKLKWMSPKSSQTPPKPKVK